MIGQPLLVALSSIFLLFLGDLIGSIGYRRSPNAWARRLRLVAASLLYPLCFAIITSSALLLRIWIGPAYYRGSDIPVPLYLASSFPTGILVLFLLMMQHHVPPEPPRRRNVLQRIAIVFTALFWGVLIILHGVQPVLGYGSYTPVSRQWPKDSFRHRSFNNRRELCTRKISQPSNTLHTQCRQTRGVTVS